MRHNTDTPAGPSRRAVLRTAAGAAVAGFALPTIIPASALGRGGAVAPSERITLVVQIESRKGLENLAEIAAVEGIDALFIGPSDLAASLGHLGDPLHAEVTAAIDEARATIEAAGKPAGIFAVSPEHARAAIAAEPLMPSHLAWCEPGATGRRRTVRR